MQVEWQRRRLLLLASEPGSGGEEGKEDDASTAAAAAALTRDVDTPIDLSSTTSAAADTGLVSGPSRPGREEEEDTRLTTAKAQLASASASSAWTGLATDENASPPTAERARLSAPPVGVVGVGQDEDEPGSVPPQLQRGQFFSSTCSLFSSFFPSTKLLSNPRPFARTAPRTRSDQIDS